MQINLHISKKSSTFVPDLLSNHTHMRAIFLKSAFLMGFLAASLMVFAERPILYIYKHDGTPDKDGVYQYLLSQGKTIEARKALDQATLPPRDEYAQYEWVLMSADADADNAEVLALTRGYAYIPLLNMKAFSYSPERLNWGQPNSGSLSSNGRFITVERDDHPIFKTLGKKKGDRIQVLEEINEQGLMPIDVNLPGTHCLATSLTRDIDDYDGDGEPQTFLHEVPANMRGGSKYICLPIALSSSLLLTDEGKQLVDAVIDYLLDNAESVVRPQIQMTSFAINGIVGIIQDDAIKMEIDLALFPEINPKAVTPEITVADPYTHCTPHGPVNLTRSDSIPVPFVVSDYINRRVYDVSVHFINSEAIDNVYSVGEWVSIYDIFGRKVAATKEDVYSMDLPRGAYIVTTSNGTAFKILR